MENQTASSKSIIVNYGLILGLVSLIPSLVKYTMGSYLERDTLSSVIGIVITIVFIVLGIKKYKQLNGNLLSFGQAVKVGMGITLISLIISLIYLAIFSNVIEPDFKNQVIEMTQQQWIDAGMTDEMIEKQLPYVKDYFAISMYGGITIMALFIGFVISAISGAIMKESKEE